MALNNFVKRIRNIMRNDAGINGDAQRIEQLAWMLFLKIYDTKEEDWAFMEANYHSFIPEPCVERTLIDDSYQKGKEEGMEKGIAEGMEMGMKQGMEKGMNLRSLEIARKMLAKGMDEASVKDMTRLTAEEIKLLKAEIGDFFNK